MSRGSTSARASYLLACNGAAVAAPRGRGSRRPERQDLATYGGGKNVVLTIADITDRMARALPAVVVDLIELAALVYAADQCCKRTPGRRFDYGRRWHRALRFEVAVRQPEFWSRPDVLAALVETLHFLSEDDYEFRFHDAPDAPPLPAYLAYGAGTAEPEPMDHVMLMSGGLDSLAGAAEQVLRHGRRVAMVSHRPVDHMATRQRTLVTTLASRGGRPPGSVFHVPVTCHKAGLVGEDFTQRSRSFLYASIGAAAADLFGLSEVWFYENGVTSVNLPLCAQEVGGRATRTTHPQALHGFGRIFSLVFGRPFAASNGFFWQTKQDVLELLRRHSQADLARVAVSCSHTRETTRPAPHCGMCSQCLARRVASVGAAYGPDDPIDGYRADPLVDPRAKDEERILAERFVGQAREVARMTAVEDFARRYAGELSRVYPYLNMPTPVGAERLFDLHLRHARQVGEAVVQRLAAHAGDFWGGRLADTCALAYAYGTGRSTRSRAGAASGVGDGGAGPGEVASASGTLEVNEVSFTVTTDAGRHTFRRRSKQLFALLARVARRPGQRVWFDQLREPGEVWGHVVVEDVTIRGAVGRLRRELRDAGLGALADTISTGSYQDRPYVLLDPSELELRSN